MKRSRHCSEATNAVVCVWLVLLLLPTTEANAPPAARTRSRFMAAKQPQQPQPQEQEYRTESNTNDTREAETTFMNGEIEVSARNKRSIVPSGDGGTLLQCPQSSDVIAFRSSCFRIFTFRASWAEARTFCRSMQHLNHRWDLASLTDYRSTRRIISALESYNSRMQGNVWVGGNDLQVEGDWRWVASNAQLQYREWQQGEPNNNHGNEHCLELTRFLGYKWTDRECNFRNAFVCELDLGAIQPPPATR